VSARPLACVLGDMDLVRPLGLAGIRCGVVARRSSPAAHSRFTCTRVDWADNYESRPALEHSLLDFARRQSKPPVLFFQTDGDLLFASAHREALGEELRFFLPDESLVRDLVRKDCFFELARRLDLPVPPSVRLSSGASREPPALAIEPPWVIKPLTRRDVSWQPVAGEAKALRVDSPQHLRSLWPVLRAAGIDALAQQLVPGSEEHVESYHAYVDPDGELTAEFTGRKLRTLPPVFGQTTALTITWEPDVAELGRHCMERLGLRGVAKLDFKRGPDGELRLLEVNPRFNLWHLPGAVAGVNLPALAYADLAGRARPPAGPLRPGVRWTVSWHDLRARAAHGLGWWAWLRFQLACETRSVIALDDPQPFLHALLGRPLRRLAARSSGS
jgi:D-aspartate ligase